MKRVIAACVLLAVVTTLCGVAMWFQKHTIAHIQENVDLIEKAYNLGDTEESLRLCEEMAEQYQSATQYFPLFMRHSDYDRLEESIIALAPLLKADDPAYFKAELLRCRYRLETLADMETPIIKNIF